MEPIGDNYTAYSLKDLEALTAEAERLNNGNGLEFYLKKHGFKQESEHVFSLTHPEQVIELIPGEKGKSYINRLDENDKGQFIQFLQNRLPDGQRVACDHSISAFLGAVLLGKYLEENNKRRHFKMQRSPVKKKGKGKGL